VEGGALLTDEFSEFSKNYVMFLHVTTRIPGRKDDDLLGKVGGTGFPSFFMLDADGEVIGQHRGERSAAGFEKTATAAREFVALREAAAKGDATAKVRLVLAEARMGKLNADELQQKIAQAGALDDAVKKEYRGVLAGLLMEKAQRTAVGERLLELHAQGLIPEDAMQRRSFYGAIWSAALYKKDAAAARIGLDGMKEVYGDDARYAAFFTNAEKQIAEMTGEAKEEAAAAKDTDHATVPAKPIDPR